MASLLNQQPRTIKTAGRWDCEEVRELNAAVVLALEYFNIPQNGDRGAAKALAKRARAWSIRWYKLHRSGLVRGLTENPAGRAIINVPNKVSQKTIKYTADMDALQFDIWELAARPIIRVGRDIGGRHPYTGEPAMPIGSRRETRYNRRLRLCPAVTAGQRAQVVDARNVAVLERKLERNNGDEFVSVDRMRSQGVLLRLPEFIIQLGFYGRAG